MDVEAIVEAISTMGDEDLRRVREAMGRRRRKLEQSSVLERRAYGSGLLQLEYRADPKTGKERGPYWYFHYRKGGRQRSVYVGKTDTPEAVVDEKLGRHAS